MSISLVAAIAKNDVIGNNNELPWYLPEDLKRFKKITEGKTVVMGKKTFDSIIAKLGRPLPNRLNIVLSRQRNLPLPKGVILLNDLEQLKKLDKEEIIIIGGGEIYRLFIDLADKMHITHIDQEVEGDVYFPKIDPQIWQKISEEKHEGFSFVDYERINKEKE